MNRYLRDQELSSLRQSLSVEDRLMRSGLFTDADTGRTYFTGYQYRTLYDWDQYFEAIVQAYMGWGSEYIRNGVTIFLDHQREDGFIARSVPDGPYHAREHVKPFLAQIALLVSDVYGELDWLSENDYFGRMQRYLDYWLVAMDSTGIGLSEWMSAPHTGMDNQHERAGYWQDRISVGVDLNSYLVRECRAFAALAERLGHGDTASRYRVLADERVERVRRWMWDADDGFFYDLNTGAARGWHPDTGTYEPETVIAVGSSAGDGSHAGARMHADLTQAMAGGAPPFIHVRCVSGFAPLWAGIATPEQASRLVYDHLLNRDEFWSPAPVATMARSERWYSQTQLPCDLGCSWRANTWIPTNYMLYHALRDYGYDQIARMVLQATVSLVAASGNREYYNAETGEGCGLDPFWGWSLLAHFLPYEAGADSDITHLE
jgi:hypothetical protein